MTGDKRKDFDSRLRRARLSAFLHALTWKNYLGIGAAILALAAIVLVYAVKFGSLKLRGRATGHEVSNFVAPSQNLPSAFYITVQLDSGGSARVVLPRGVEHQPDKQMKLSIYEAGFWLFKNEVVKFDGYVDSTTSAGASP